MFYQKDKRGMYILRAMEDISLNGDAYTTEDELYKVCHRENRYLTYSAFREDMHHLLKEKCLYLEISGIEPLTSRMPFRRSPD